MAEPDLEQDLYNSEYIRMKAAGSDAYCQNLYAAMCNNEFQKLAVEPILADDRWSCSWRYAGGIASRLRSGMEMTDYMQYYCSGIWTVLEPGDNVTEGVVTAEITQDLMHIGWVVCTATD